MLFFRNHKSNHRNLKALKTQQIGKKICGFKTDLNWNLDAKYMCEIYLDLFKKLMLGLFESDKIKLTSFGDMRHMYQVTKIAHFYQENDNF